MAHEGRLGCVEAGLDGGVARVVAGLERMTGATTPPPKSLTTCVPCKIRDRRARFRIAVDSKPAVEVGLSAGIVDKNGKVVASRLFEEGEPFEKVEPPEPVAAFGDAFG
jgi:hypothetical protein